MEKTKVTRQEFQTLQIQAQMQGIDPSTIIDQYEIIGKTTRKPSTGEHKRRKSVSAEEYNAIMTSALQQGHSKTEVETEYVIKGMAAQMRAPGSTSSSAPRKPRVPSESRKKSEDEIKNRLREENKIRYIDKLQPIAERHILGNVGIVSMRHDMMYGNQAYPIPEKTFSYQLMAVDTKNMMYGLVNEFRLSRDEYAEACRGESLYFKLVPLEATPKTLTTVGYAVFKVNNGKIISSIQLNNAGLHDAYVNVDRAKRTIQDIIQAAK